jgi:hypothetical protein
VKGQRRAQPQRIAGPQEPGAVGFEALAVDKGAVGAAQVHDADAGSRDLKRCMPPRNLLTTQKHVAAGLPPEGQGARRQGNLAPAGQHELERSRSYLRFCRSRTGRWLAPQRFAQGSHGGKPPIRLLLERLADDARHPLGHGGVGLTQGPRRRLLDALHVAHLGCGRRLGLKIEVGAPRQHLV